MRVGKGYVWGPGVTRQGDQEMAKLPELWEGAAGG